MRQTIEKGGRKVIITENANGSFFMDFYLDNKLINHYTAPSKVSAEVDANKFVSEEYIKPQLLNENI